MGGISSKSSKNLKKHMTKGPETVAGLLNNFKANLDNKQCGS